MPSGERATRSFSADDSLSALVDYVCVLLASNGAVRCPLSILGLLSPPSFGFLLPCRTAHPEELESRPATADLEHQSVAALFTVSARQAALHTGGRGPRRRRPRTDVLDCRPDAQRPAALLRRMRGMHRGRAPKYIHALLSGMRRERGQREDRERAKRGESGERLKRAEREVRSELAPDQLAAAGGGGRVAWSEQAEEERAARSEQVEGAEGGASGRSACVQHGQPFSLCSAAWGAASSPPRQPPLQPEQPQGNLLSTGRWCYTEHTPDLSVVAHAGLVRCCGSPLWMELTAVPVARAIPI